MTTHTDETVDGVWVDRGEGSGSLSKEDNWLQNKHKRYGYATDGRSVTRTTFYWNGSDDTPERLRSRDRHQKHRDPSNRRGWDVLASWNDGEGAPSRQQDNFNADVSRWIQTFCSKLGCTSYQQERVVYVIDEIDLGSFSRIPAEHVILGTITLVVDDDTDADPDEWDFDEWIVYDDSFVELMQDVEMGREMLWEVRKKVHKQSDAFDTGI